MTRRDFMGLLSVAVAGTTRLAMASREMLDKAENAQSLAESLHDPREWQYFLQGNWSRIPLRIREVSITPRSANTKWGKVVEARVEFEEMHITESQTARYFDVLDANGEQLLQCHLDDQCMVSGGTATPSMTIYLPVPT